MERRPGDIFENSYEPYELEDNMEGFMPLQPTGLGGRHRDMTGARAMADAGALRDAQMMASMGAMDDPYARAGLNPMDDPFMNVREAATMLGAGGRTKDPFFRALQDSDPDLPQYHRISGAPPGYDWRESLELGYPPRGLAEHGYSFELDPTLDRMRPEMGMPVEAEEAMGYGADQFVTRLGGGEDPMAMMGMRSGAPDSPSRLRRAMGRLGLGGGRSARAWDDSGLGYDDRDMFGRRARRYDDDVFGGPRRRRSFDMPLFGRRRDEAFEMTPPRRRRQIGQLFGRAGPY